MTNKVATSLSAYIGLPVELEILSGSSNDDLASALWIISLGTEPLRLVNVPQALVTNMLRRFIHVLDVVMPMSVNARIRILSTHSALLGTALQWGVAIHEQTICL